MDRGISVLLEGLKTRGRLDETTIVLTADHGENLGEHELYFHHGGLYDQTVHVPLIIHGPGLEPERIKGLVESVDIAPTLLPTIDEDPPIPTSSYGISKAVTEDLARHMNRRYGVPFVGLRFSNIFYDTPGHVTSYERIPRFWENLHSKKFDLWAYVDARDTADSCVQALESDITGAEVMTIAAADTVMRQTNEELIAAVYPGCKLRPGTGPHDSLISIERARKLIGYDPKWTWRKVLNRT